ncbi:MAG: DsrE family protein, partial [Gammaproteobacteria bacterium]|nr:DsrE family protein [Gammaproteobacteria bacterium]
VAHAATAPDPLNKANCVASPWTDAAGNPITVDQKFGDGAAAVTRCLAKPKGMKVVYQFNKYCEDTACTKVYAVGNILNHIRDLEVTHGVPAGEFQMMVIVHAGGWKAVLDPAKGHPNAADNVFADQIKTLIATRGVKVMFCQNTANSNKVLLSQMLDGVGFVTSGVSALADLQRIGYNYVQP